MKTKSQNDTLLLITTLVWCASTLFAAAQGSAFTYQGRLHQAGAPAQGAYDLQFAICDAATDGNVVAGPLTNMAVAVSNGLFTVLLDFGSDVFAGSTRWLEIGVRTNGGTDAFTLLSPRQPITPTPYALFASNTATLGGQPAIYYAPASGAPGYVAKSGDTMTGTLNLPANGILAGGGQLALSGGNVGIGTAGPAQKLEVEGGVFIDNSGNAHGLDTGVALTVDGKLNKDILHVRDVGANSKLVVNSSGNVGIGVASPASKLEVAGQVKITGGSPGAGKVLTSDASGVATWQNPSSAGSAWNLAGNAGTSSATNFLGTTDNQPVEIRVNNQRALRIEPTAGGLPNIVAGSALNSVVQGVSAGTIGGGTGNTLQSGSSEATIAGGARNTIQTNANTSTIGGGADNLVQTNAPIAVIAGGYLNTVGADAAAAVIAGGRNNQARGSLAAIGGGQNNIVRSTQSTVAGGSANMISSNGGFAAISGGQYNAILNDVWSSAIAGGECNIVQPGAGYSFIAAGKSNAVGGWNAFAAGYRAKALHNGSFVWGDATEADVASTANNQFTLRAAGGLQLSVPGSPNPIPAMNIDVASFVTGSNSVASHYLRARDLGGFYTAFLVRGDGNVGIGTDSPGARLDVRGTVTASNFVGSGASLTGIGATAIAPGAISNPALADAAVTSAKIAGAQVVKSLNGLKDDVTLVAGSNVSIATSGNLLQISATGSGSGWNLTGNAGTSSYNFVGTTDAQPVEIRVNGQRAMRWEPSGTNTPNIIGGHAFNQVSAGSWGTTIAGGGPNIVGTNSLWATIGGGAGNSITNASGATIAGGLGNSIGAGKTPLGMSAGATVSGGFYNSIGSNSVCSTIIGGSGNFINPYAFYATIAGGQSNLVTGDYAFAAGRQAKAHYDGTFVWADSTPADFASTGVNQFLIRATGGVGIGTTNPQAMLDVAGVVRVSGNVRICNPTTGATVVEIGEGLDYAEGFDVADESKPEPGTVLVIDSRNIGKLAVSRQAYDCKVAGIVAGANGLGSAVRLAAGRFDCDVALAGRVYCNVDAAYGPVYPGDLLTTSPTPGYAMAVKDRALAQGAILGKAMQSLAEGQKGQILVLVTLQ